MGPFIVFETAVFEVSGIALEVVIELEVEDVVFGGLVGPGKSSHAGQQNAFHSNHMIRGCCSGSTN